MIPEVIIKSIKEGSLLFRATKFAFWESGVGIDEGDTDAEFLILSGPFRTHFEVHGINEKYIKSNFNIENKKCIISEKEEKVEVVYDWLPSKNSENEPTSLEFHIQDNQIVFLKFWFMAGTGGQMHLRTISFDVKHIEYCPNCYDTFEVDFMSEEHICPHCGNIRRIKR